MSGKKKDIDNEILNFEDLDVDELERRLEMAVGGDVSLPDAWLCFGVNNECPGQCNAKCDELEVCGADCPNLCALDCIIDGCGGDIAIP